MPRYRLTVEYDGGPYKGFQVQANQPTVQASLEAAIKAFSGQDLRIAVAGRTDTGVHATAQVIHCDLDRDWPAEVVRNAMNAHLAPQPISVLDAAVVPDDFHARFSARGRRYLYRILNRPSRPGIERGHVWHVRKPLDVEAMRTAAGFLIGHHDFTTFRDVNCQATSPVKTLDVITLEREREEIRLTFAARSFLHRQVRSMTGSLVEVGLGRWTPEDLKAALEARNRDACAAVAPSDGLYLVGVEYE